jgi:hypothetical protein
MPDENPINEPTGNVAEHALILRTPASAVSADVVVDVLVSDHPPAIECEFPAIL